MPITPPPKVFCTKNDVSLYQGGCLECADQHDPSRGQEEQTNPRQSDFDAGHIFLFQLKNPGETFHFHSCRGSHQFLAGEDFSISSVLFFPFRLPIWSLATGICQSDKRKEIESKLEVKHDSYV